MDLFYVSTIPSSPNRIVRVQSKLIILYENQEWTLYYAKAGEALVNFLQQHIEFWYTFSFNGGYGQGKG